MVSGWWKEHTGQIIEEFLLSDKGLIVGEICAGWLYLGNSAIAFMGWPVGNPAVDGRKVYTAMEIMIQQMREIARKHGAVALLSYTNIPGILKLQDKMGFIVGDEAITNMVIGC